MESTLSCPASAKREGKGIHSMKKTLDLSRNGFPSLRGVLPLSREGQMFPSEGIPL